MYEMGWRVVYDWAYICDDEKLKFPIIYRCRDTKKEMYECICKQSTEVVQTSLTNQ